MPSIDELIFCQEDKPTSISKAEKMFFLSCLVIMGNSLSSHFLVKSEQRYLSCIDLLSLDLKRWSGYLQSLEGVMYVQGCG